MVKKMNYSRLRRQSTRIHGGNMMFLMPTVALFTVVVLIPFIQGIPYSFTNWKSIVSTNRDFIGFRNYKYLLTNKFFLESLGVTFKFTVLYMISSNVMGLMLALLIHRSSWRSPSKPDAAHRPQSPCLPFP